MKERLKKLSALIKSGKATEYHMEVFQDDKEQLKKLKRVHKAERDMSYFFYEYFGEEYNPGNADNQAPKGATIENMPDFHKELCGILDSASNFNTGARICWSAARGSAKSTFLSGAHPIREICFRKRKMILIISETASASQKFLRWISGQLRYNEKLREDFGHLLHPNQKANEIDSKEQFLTTSGTMLATSSLGKQIRGYKNGSQRPDLCLLDDLESRASNNTATLRQQNLDWLTQDLEPALDPKGSLIFMGTMVHISCLLAYVLQNRVDFLRNRFPAILNEPKRKDLWAKFEEIFKNYEPSKEEIEKFAKATEQMPSPNERAALRFFDANKEEMLIGEDPDKTDGRVESIWPSRFPTEKLMLIKLSVGSKAWATEYQNTAVDEENRIFNSQDYRRHNVEHFSKREYELFGYVDWALGGLSGKSESGDSSVYTILAKHKITKKLYLVEQFGARMKPNDFMDIIVEMTMKYIPTIIGAESNFGQEYMNSELKARLQAAGYPAYTRMKGIHQKQKKELRIELLQPQLEKGDLVLNNHCSALENEMETYPASANDDFLDSLAGCVKISDYSMATFKQKPAGL
ncbi:MAG: phage terminase large subunit [Bacillota bacterium]